MSWITEHGPQGGDELNRVVPGENFGWPVVGYGVNYNSGLAIHEGTMREGMEHPTHFWVPSIGASGLMMYTGDRFPSWKGNLFAGGMAIEKLGRLVMDGQDVQRRRRWCTGWAGSATSARDRRPHLPRHRPSRCGADRSPQAGARGRTVNASVAAP